MAEVIIELSDEHLKAIEWAASRDAENPRSVEEYISFVMAGAAESYAKQAEAEQVETLGRAALVEQKAEAVRR